MTKNTGQNGGKIALKTAIAMMETAYIHGKLHTFALTYAKMNGEIGTKKMCCKIDPYADTDFEQIAEKVDNGGKLKKFYAVREKRTIRLFDMEKRNHFSIKTDLVIKYNNQLIDHEW